VGALVGGLLIAGAALLIYRARQKAGDHSRDPGSKEGPSPSAAAGCLGASSGHQHSLTAAGVMNGKSLTTSGQVTISTGNANMPTMLAGRPGSLVPRAPLQPAPSPALLEGRSLPDEPHTHASTATQAQDRNGSSNISMPQTPRTPDAPAGAHLAVGTRSGSSGNASGHQQELSTALQPLRLASAGADISLNPGFPGRQCPNSEITPCYSGSPHASAASKPSALQGYQQVQAGGFVSAAAALQRPGTQQRPRPNSIVLPASAAPLLEPVHEAPEGGGKQQLQPAQQGAAVTQADMGVESNLPKHLHDREPAMGCDNLPRTRAQQLALIERELKDIRHRLHEISTPSRLQPVPATFSQPAAAAQVTELTQSADANGTTTSAADSSTCLGSDTAAGARAMSTGATSSTDGAAGVAADTSLDTAATSSQSGRQASRNPAVTSREARSSSRSSGSGLLAQPSHSTDAHGSSSNTSSTSTSRSTGHPSVPSRLGTSSGGRNTGGSSGSATRSSTSAQSQGPTLADHIPGLTLVDTLG
jgi:hypothetical protein